MLKIKDNVDLKELEKYGFNVNNRNCYEKYLMDSDGIFFEHRLCVAGLLRNIFFEDNNYNSFDNLDILYDLIKANLVEKVECDE